MRQLITECFAVVAGVPIDAACMQAFHSDLAAFISSPAVAGPLLDTVEGSARLAKRVVLSGKLLNKGIPKALEAGHRGEAIEPKEMWKQAVQTHLQELANEASQEYRSRVADLTRDLAGESKTAELIEYEQLVQIHQEARQASVRILTSQVRLKQAAAFMRVCFSRTVTDFLPLVVSDQSMGRGDRCRQEICANQDSQQMERNRELMEDGVRPAMSRDPDGDCDFARHPKHCGRGAAGRGRARR